MKILCTSNIFCTLWSSVSLRILRAYVPTLALSKSGYGSRHLQSTLSSLQRAPLFSYVGDFCRPWSYYSIREKICKPHFCILWLFLSTECDLCRFVVTDYHTLSPQSTAHAHIVCASHLHLPALLDIFSVIFPELFFNRDIMTINFRKNLRRFSFFSRCFLNSVSNPWLSMAPIME